MKFYDFYDSEDVLIGTYNVGDNDPDSYLQTTIEDSVVDRVEYSNQNPKTIEQKLQGICVACEDNSITTLDGLKSAIAAAIHG